MENEIPPVDRTARVLHDGSEITADYHEINSITGQQKDYVVLSDEERSKGFVRPIRRTYLHLGAPRNVGLAKVRSGGCGSTTTVSQAIAETYARDPGFYNGTFCCKCMIHLPLDEFVWVDDGEQVGS